MYIPFVFSIFQRSAELNISLDPLKIALKQILSKRFCFHLFNTRQLYLNICVNKIIIVCVMLFTMSY